MITIFGFIFGRKRYCRDCHYFIQEENTLINTGKCSSTFFPLSKSGKWVFESFGCIYWKKREGEN